MSNSMARVLRCFGGVSLVRLLVLCCFTSLFVYMTADQLSCESVALLRALTNSSTRCDGREEVPIPHDLTLTPSALRAAFHAGAVSVLAGGIPKILHQTWSSREVPASLLRWVRSWAPLHPDWLHVFWTDADLREFLVAEHPDVLPMFDGYPQRIMREDMARTYLLWTYGGVYADMDYEALSSLEPALKVADLCIVDSPFKKWEEVQNSLMASRPRHPFWLVVFNIFRERQPSPLQLGADTIYVTGPGLLSEAVRRYMPASVCKLSSQRFMFGQAAEDGRAVAKHHFMHAWDVSDARDHVKQIARGAITVFAWWLAGLLAWTCRANLSISTVHRRMMASVDAWQAARTSRSILPDVPPGTLGAASS